MRHPLSTASALALLASLAQCVGSASTPSGAPGPDAAAASSGGDGGPSNGDGACVRSCVGRTCGDDGCHGDCGPCGAGTACADGRCVADAGAEACAPVAPDANPCTQETCTGHAPVRDGTPCGILPRGRCLGGVCVWNDCGPTGGIELGAAMAMQAFCPTRIGRSSFIGPVNRPTRPSTLVAAVGQGLTRVVVDRRDALFYSTGVGNLFAVDASGAPLWGAPANYPYPSPTVSSMVLGADGNTVYAFTVSGGIVAGRAIALRKDGVERWYYGITGNISGAPVVDASRTLYFATSGNTGGITALADKGTSASLRWRALTTTLDYGPLALAPDGSALFAATVAVDGTTLTSLYRVEGLTSSAPSAIDVRDAPYTGHVAVSTVLGATTVYVGAANATLYSYTDRLVRRWKCSPPSPTTPGNIAGISVAEDGTVILATTTGVLYAYTDQGDHCASAWQTSANGQFHSAPVIDAEGRVYVFQESPAVTRAYSPAKGKTLWEISDLTLGLPGGVLLRTDGQLVGSDGKALLLLAP